MTSPVPWNRFTMPTMYAPGPTGAPIPGSLLYFFQSGTTTPLATYADQALSQPNKNPVPANQAGIFPNIFLQSASYRVVWTDQNSNELQTWDPVSPYVPAAISLEESIILSFCADGNGLPIAAGKIGDDYIPIDCEIVAAVLQADQAGLLSIDVWMAPFVVNSPPTVLNSIVASDPPNLNDTQSYIDTTLDGWTTEIAAGTAVRYNVTEAQIVTRFTLSLVCQPTT